MITNSEEDPDTNLRMALQQNSFWPSCTVASLKVLFLKVGRRGLSVFSLLCDGIAMKRNPLRTFAALCIVTTGFSRFLTRELFCPCDWLCVSFCCFFCLYDVCHGWDLAFTGEIYAFSISLTAWLLSQHNCKLVFVIMSDQR